MCKTIMDKHGTESVSFKESLVLKWMKKLISSTEPNES